MNPSKSSGKEIMVVEDDKAIRESLCQVIDEEGYEAVPAANGREAIELLRSGAAPPALILLDMMMPEMDGKAFRLEQQKLAIAAAIPVVIISAHANVRQLAASVEAADYLRKPLDLDELLRIIDRFCKD